MPNDRPRNSRSASGPGSSRRDGPRGRPPKPGSKRPATKGSGRGRGESSGRAAGKSGSGARRDDRRDGARRDDRRDGARRDGRREGARRDDRRDGARRDEGGDRDLAGPKQWGRIARRGAGNMDYEDPAEVEKRAQRKAEYLERQRAREARAAERAETERSLPSPPERTLPGAADLERTATRAVKRSRATKTTERRPLPARPHPVVDPAQTLKRLVGEPRATTLNRKLNEGAKAFGAERFKDARSALTPVAKEAPELPEGRELLGLTLYRLGQWKEAADHLESFRALSGSTEQHPVLADCYRALGRWSDVDALWEELGEASPSAELVTEGRIVVAGAKADQGDLTSAILILEQNWRTPKRPQGHHLRRAYALADLYDQAGRIPRARELFRWVEGHAPDLADVRDRVKALG